jgi:hypothetical protein
MMLEFAMNDVCMCAIFGPLVFKTDNHEVLVHMNPKHFV